MQENTNPDAQKNNAPPTLAKKAQQEITARKKSVGKE
jgi:hypothetical protein